jgi:hypothetical protein
MWSGNDVNTDQFAYSTSRSGAGICGCLDGTHIATYKNGHVARANILLAQELHISSFDHRVRSLNGSDETFGFDHTECF